MGMGEKICVGVVTRSRPKMLAQLLDSLLVLESPAGATLQVIVVENASKPTLDGTLTRLSNAMEVSYQTEPRLGIPFARNRVLAISLENGCDCTAFVDDDERADPALVKNLYAALCQRDLDLVGGPVQLLPIDHSLTLIQKILRNGLEQRRRDIAAKALQHVKNGTDGQITILTNNWMIRNRFLERTGLRFDESLGLSGGSDTRFFKQAKALGAGSGWAPDGWVYEETPPNRLSIAYQFDRARSQSIASFRMKVHCIDAFVVAASVGFVFWKTLSAGALILSSLGTGARSLLSAVRAVGFATGRLQALFGSTAEFYRNVDGH